MYFVKGNSLLRSFDEVDIKHVLRIENQEANDFTQIAYGQRFQKKRLEELIKVKEKLILTNPFPFELEKSKLVRVERFDELQNSVEISAIDNLSTNDWKKSIIDFLENLTGVIDKKNQI